jgi:hypothetical protein
MQNLGLESPASQIEKQRRTALPYTALDVRCPMCGSCSAKRCRSSKRTVLRYPHFQRIELAAERFRAEARLRILEGIRRHPFAQVFSERRMAVEGFNVRKVSAMSGEGFEGPLLRSGERAARRASEVVR